MGSGHSRCGLKACYILWEPAWLMTSSLFHRLLSVCSIIQYTCPVFSTLVKPKIPQGYRWSTHHFLPIFYQLFVFCCVSRTPAGLPHVFDGSSSMWAWIQLIFLRQNFRPKPKVVKIHDFFTIFSANVKYRLGQTLKIINFGSKLTQKVNFKEKSNETIQPKGWASWSGCHNWKTRWWDLFWSC